MTPNGKFFRLASYCLMACAIVFGSVVLAGNDPESSNRFPACPIRQWTGLYCSGCGSTRAMHHLLNGRVGTAMKYNPLAVIAIPILGIMNGWPDRFRSPWIARSAIAILISYSILRNVDCWPFRYLAPPSPVISAISDSTDSFDSRSSQT